VLPPQPRSEGASAVDLLSLRGLETLTDFALTHAASSAATTVTHT
jgi:hypothetical protein